MKKIMAIILALTLTFSLVACGGDSSSAAVSGSGGATPGREARLSQAWTVRLN